MKTIESFRRIFSSSVVTKSFCRQCTRKIEKSRCKAVKIRCILIDATERNTAYISQTIVFLVLFIALLHFGFAFRLLSNVNFYFCIVQRQNIYCALYNNYCARRLLFYHNVQTSLFLCNILMYCILSISSFYFVALYYDTIALIVIKYSQFSAKLLIERSQRSSLIVERYRYRESRENNSTVVWML